MLRLKKLLSFIFNLIFPRSCINCDKFLPGSYYTGFCLDCIKLTKEFNIKQHQAICNILEDKIIDDFNARFVYNDVISKIITNLKFYDQPHYAEILANLLTKQVNGFKSENCLLVPVPVHTKRLLKRKYNQASLLTKYISKNTDIKYSNNALKRVKHTPHQTGQSANIRKKQLKSAFLAKSTIIKDKDIILIDDVFTTGSTVKLCAQELKDKGAKSVKVVTIAYTAL